MRRNSESFAVVERLLDRVTEGAFQRFGARVLLLKQTHCDPALLLRMHIPFVEELGRLRERADPARILTSQFLAPLEKRGAGSKSTGDHRASPSRISLAGSKPSPS